jgi:16S rRNA (cytosine1402-N4)-methyltransferase
MVAQVLAGLRPTPNGRYVDGTLGGGGHAAAILEASSPTGWLYGCDCDDAAIHAAAERLGGYAGRFELRQLDFADLTDWIPIGSCDGVLLDLGVSSPQLDQAQRGFSFQQDGPLDMRMDVRQAQTAADLVNEAGVDTLTRIFRDLGEEPEARRLARAIDSERRIRRFETTRQLAALIERMSPRRGKRLHPATRVFQALRMAVNDETGSLQRGLGAALNVLKPGGRLAVITFHSVEDRIVKRAGAEWSRDYTVAGDVDIPELRRPSPLRARWVSRKAVQPDPDEIRVNPRARSAQLRLIEKV